MELTAVLVSALLGLCALISGASAITCYQCSHVDMKVIKDDAYNSGALIQRDLDKSNDKTCALSKQAFRDAAGKEYETDCNGGNAKCTKAETIFIAKGILSDFEAEMTWTVRGCEDRPSGEGSGCSREVEKVTEEIFGEFFQLSDMNGWGCSCSDKDLCNSASTLAPALLTMVMTAVRAVMC